MQTKKPFERSMVCGILLTNSSAITPYSGNRVRRKSVPCGGQSKDKGKYLEITQMGETYKGISEGIDRDGGILLSIDGKTGRS